MTERFTLHITREYSLIEGMKSFFSKVEILKKNVILGPIFHDFCLIGYKSINRRLRLLAGNRF